MEIDRREDKNEMNGTDNNCVFEVESAIEARVIRIRQIGPNANCCRYVILMAFEVFGGFTNWRRLLLV
jgi:hypothetical protein